MTPSCAKELLDVVMLDDFVARRVALDLWTRRWVVSVRLDHPVPEVQAAIYGEAWKRHAKAALLDKLLVGILNEGGSVEPIGFEVASDGVMRVATMRLCVLLESPLEVS